MTARAIGVFTIEFPDPTQIDYVNNQFKTLNDSISFQYRGLSNIQTLSTKGASAGNDPYGILYLPDLSTDACRSNQSQHVPPNTTTIANLPADRNYALIALAPWYSPQCMLEYFSAARQHQATKAFITYLPGHDNAQPPVLNNPAWDLQDGGMWQQDNTFPTYAVSSTSGNTLINQLSLYSGNLSTVPNGDDLARIFDSTSYVRLWATVSTDSANTLPSLWVFLVIVLAILMAAIGITSLCMHVIQRRRRNALRQRVLNGQVNLEALGVKRLTVSQQLLDKMPIVTYTASLDVEKPSSPLAPAVDTDTASKPPLARHLSAAPTSTPSNASFSQPTCPICIDDFQHNETHVRELPCRHIFHPDCIDTFLLRSSSLCPMCKQSVLPAGVCPVKITNMMVRRERHISRIRARSDWSAAHGGAPQPVAVTVGEHARGAFGSIGRAVAGRRIFSAPERRTTQPQGDIEMGPASTTIPPTTSLQASTIPTSTIPISSQPPIPPPAAAAASTPYDCDTVPPPSLNRREWARQRALHLLGPRHAPAASDLDDDLDHEERARPAWKRMVTKVFPGFR